MDYIPPERPALIAQARDEDRRHVGKIIDTGQIDQMIQFDDFDETSTFEEWDRIRKRGLKPGQYFPLCKAEDNQLTFYVQEHKPCSVPTVLCVQLAAAEFQGNVRQIKQNAICQGGLLECF